MATTLSIRHDGIRAHADVVRGQSTCSLSAALEAALQSDEETAAVYADVLRAIAPRVYLSIVREIDGSPDNGCCWLAVRLTDGINGDTLTTRMHCFTRNEFRDWKLTDAQMRDEKAAILRRAAAIGLGQAQYWVGSGRTVSDAVAGDI